MSAHNSDGWSPMVAKRKRRSPPEPPPAGEDEDGGVAPAAGAGWELAVAPRGGGAGGDVPPRGGAPQQGGAAPQQGGAADERASVLPSSGVPLAGPQELLKALEVERSSLKRLEYRLTGEIQKLQVEESMLLQMQQRAEEEASAMADVASHVIATEGLDLSLDLSMGLGLEDGGDNSAWSWDHHGWMEGYRSQPEEFEYWVTSVAGEIPTDLEGTYFHNGPGMFQKGDDWMRHPFDGDGMVCMTAFKDGHAYFRSRYVKTEGYEAENEQGKVLYRNTFGTQRRGGLFANLLDVSQKNVANTGVMLWGGKLLALWEAMQPYELDPVTLETRGVDLLGGLLQPGLPFTTGLRWLDAALRGVGLSVGGLPLSAHPRVDQHRQRAINFGYELRPELRRKRGGGSGVGHEVGLQTRFHFWEFAEGGFEVAARREYHLSGYGFLHDFMVTEDYYILVENPVTLDVWPFLLGDKCPVDCLTFHGDRKTRVHVIPRPGAREGAVEQVVEIDSCFIFHHINSYQVGGARGQLVMDVVQYDRMPDFRTQVPTDCGHLEQCRWSGQPGNRTWRHLLDLSAGTASSSPAAAARVAAAGAGAGGIAAAAGAAEAGVAGAGVESRQTLPRVVEFPSVDPRRAGRYARYAYMAGVRHPRDNGPLQALIKLDLATGEEWVYDSGPRVFTSEPQFIPRPGGEAEDDGWVVGTVYNAGAGTSEVVVLDARDFGGGAEPVAVLRLKAHVPYGLHGAWSEVYYGGGAFSERPDAAISRAVLN